MDDKIKKMLEKLEARANKAALEWIEAEEKQVELNTRSILNETRESVIAKALGFKREFGEWSIDNCNGRNSAAREWLTGRAGVAARAWLDEQAGDLPVLPAKAIASLKKHYLDTLEHELQGILAEKAYEDAKNLVAKIYPDYEQETS